MPIADGKICQFPPPLNTKIFLTVLFYFCSHRSQDQFRYSRNRSSRTLYHDRREATVEQNRREYVQRTTVLGSEKKLIPTLDNELSITQFCYKVMRLQDLGVVDVIINPDCKYIPAGGDAMLDGEYVPLAALRERANVRVYVGITGQADQTNRPGEYIAKKYYGGSKEAMEEDGWQTHWLLKFIDTVFDDRRYTVGWVERYLQLFCKEFDLIVCEWGDDVEPEPIYGENRSNIGDHGEIILYMCMKFD